VSDVKRANQLYESVKERYAQFSGDSTQAGLIIEEAHDALKLYGETSQHRKVELKEIIGKAEASLPPSTARAVLDRTVAALLRVLWPQQKLWQGVVSGLVTLAVLMVSVPSVRSPITKRVRLLMDRHSCYLTPSGRRSAKEAGDHAEAGSRYFVMATKSSDDWSSFDLFMRKALIEYQIAESKDECKAVYKIDVGATLNRLGRYNEAVNPLLKGVRLDSSLAWFHNELCIALKKAGQIKMSDDECQKAIGLDTKNSAFDEYQLLDDLKHADQHRKQ
jgi:tetratricopeptide (TPR) repeat protein